MVTLPTCCALFVYDSEYDLDRSRSLIYCYSILIKDNDLAHREFFVVARITVDILYANFHCSSSMS